MGARANLTTAGLTLVLPEGLGADLPRWRLTGGERDGNRGLLLRSSRLPGTLVPFQPSAQASLPTLLADALDLLATCACIANQAAAAAAEVEAVSAWCRWQPPRPLLDRVRTAGVGSRAPLAMPRESAHAVERRFLMAQAQQRLAAGCAVQLAFISFALTPLLFARLLLLSLQLTCEACCTLLLACAVLTAGVLYCMLCMLFMLCSLVGGVLRLVRWARRGLLSTARELTVGSSRELTWLEVLLVMLEEMYAASTLTPGPLVRSLLAMVWSALMVVIILVSVLAIASVTAVVLAISRVWRAALALLVSLAAPITRVARYMGAAVASHCVPSSGLAAALMDLTWWSAVLAWVVGRRSAACTARMAASTVRAVRHRWEARPTMVPLLLSVPPLMLAALAVALLVRCGDDT